MSAQAGPPRILIVDDSETSLTLLRGLFEKAGAHVSTALDAQEALEIIEARLEGENKIELLGLDVRMPKIDGYQLATAVRAIGFKGPIIAFTGTATIKGKKGRGCSRVRRVLQQAHLV